MRNSEPKLPSAPHETDAQIAGTLALVLADHPLTFDLSEAQRADLVNFALQERKFNDMTWLETQVVRMKAGIPLLSATTSGESPASKTPAPSEIPVARPVTVCSQDELAAVLERHREWIKTVLEPSKELSAGRANLKGNDLRGFNLDGADLRSANLEGCDLRGVQLTAANLAGSRLSKSRMNGACLEKARLRRADLQGADLRDASLRGADLRHARLEGALLEGADLSGTILDKGSPPQLAQPKRSESGQLAAEEVHAKAEASSSGPD